MSVRLQSGVLFAVLAALTSACTFPRTAAPNSSNSRPSDLPLSGTSWVLESATNSPSAAQPAQPAPAATNGQQAAVSPGVALAPMQASWMLPDRGQRPTLAFSADRNAASGSTGCNRYFGDFEAGSNDLSFGGLATTRMMCFNDLAVQELAYLDALSKVDGYSNTGTSLTLTTSDGRRLSYSPLKTPAPGAVQASYRYLCDDGLRFIASFDPASESATLQLPDGTSATLKQEPAGSGAAYASQRYRLHTKGNEALLNTLSDGSSRHCVAPPSQQG